MITQPLRGALKIERSNIPIVMKFTLDDIKNSPAGKLNQHLFQEKPKKTKRAKYRNSKVEYEGMVFDSKKEYKRYRELMLLLKAGKISNPQRQVKFVLIEKQEGEKECSYYADFVYIDALTGETIVEDVKSEATRKLSTYIIKRKLMKERHGIVIIEV